MKIFTLIVLLAASISAATISGKVTDDAGIPLEGIRMVAQSFCSKPRVAFTNSKGTYRIIFPDVPCYSASVRPDHPGYTYAYPDAAVFMGYPQGRANFILTNQWMPVAEPMRYFFGW